MSLKNKSSKDLVIDLAERSNLGLPLPIGEGNLTVLNKNEFTPIDAVNKVNLVTLPSVEYEGFVPIEYDRVNLETMFNSHIPRLTGVGATNLHDLLPWMSDELGLNLNPEDFHQVKFVWLNEYEEVNIPLRAYTRSLLYSGESIIHFTRRRKTLDEVILKKNQVDGLYYPNLSRDGFVKNKEAVTQITWPVDFTEDYNSIRKHINYPWPGNGGGLRALMSSKFGFSNWPVSSNQKMEDLPTSAVAAANKDYDRVIIQYLYDDSVNKVRPYEGIAYFHYNEI